MKILFYSLVLLIPLGLDAQIFEVSANRKYREVFVDTDKFGVEYLDVLENSLLNMKDKTLRLKILNDLGYYYHTRNLKKSLAFINQGLEEALDLENLYWEGKFQVSQGAVLLRMEELDSAEEALRSAMGKIPEEESWLLYTNLGYVYERRGDLSKAFEIAGESLQRAEEHQDSKGRAMAYSDLSNLFWKQGKFEKGLEYGLKALQLFKKRGIKDLDYDFTFHVVGNNLIALGRYDEALDYFNASVEIGEKYGFYNNLSDTFIALADLYMELNQFVQAQQSANAALKYARLLENDFMIMRSFLALGKLQNTLGEFDNALEYLLECIEVAKSDFGDKFYLAHAYKALSKSYEGKGDLPESYEAFKIFHHLQEEVFNAEAGQRLAMLQTEMDVAQKEATINIQQARLDQQKTLQVFILILFAVLIFFLAVLYRVFLRKKTYSELLEKQNKEKEFLLKEIHHRVKNNMEIISSLLSLQTAQIENDSLQNIMIESQNRVHSMGLIHQNLYLGENMAAIEMKKYFLNLGQYVLETFGASERIKINCVMDALDLDIDRAIPIGLIVNELLTNALKYAFPENKIGEIDISMKESGGSLLLKVADNGIGMHVDGQISGTGFGSQLIGLLCRQLEGKMHLIQEGGTQVFFEFHIQHAA
ncbi:tetratricopeptide repeat protein [Rhodonellum sp.]|uniref:tetratricopeptide repeat protein n=1 Tax=Rhodonellum sp. TaxID=2231180 RepID=UPI0027183FB0|nr:tetratricopeptide repeat protein [Rhodonellum sp.]MDO9553488.1 tetratricopeptide repeat protein [Rhodonellum sp.]